MPKPEKTYVEPAPAANIPAGWYWFDGEPVLVLDVGGPLVMRGYNFHTKEEYRLVVDSTMISKLKAIPS